MNKTQAKEILNHSITNLQLFRKDKITLKDVETEVINLTCLSIFKNQKKLNYPLYLFSQDFIESSIESFTNSALEIFPQAYSFIHVATARIAIQQNIQWKGMWDFLKNYFEKNHGINIDDIEFSSEMFLDSLMSNSIPLNNLTKYSIDDFHVFKEFVTNWNSGISKIEKISIALHSDNYVNLGVDMYNEGNIYDAIQLYEKALEIMPNNDDALNNLRVCYSETRRLEKEFQMIEKLNFL
jgi:tetratricopeptide (TPR) repeat protein